MRARILRRAASAACLALLCAGTAVAEDTEGAFDLAASGWAAASAYYRPEAPEPFAAAGLRGGLALDGTAFAAAAGGGLGFRLALEAYSNLAGLAGSADWSLSRPDPLSLAASGNGRLSGALDLKEAWLEYALGDVDIRVGKQLFAWGLADGNNPTDNANARHVGSRLVSTLDEQKMGSLAANLVYNLPGNLGTLQGVFMPISIPNDLPSTAMDLTVAGVPSRRVVIGEDEAPGLDAANAEGGLRALFYLGSLSCSASWLSYLDRYPDYRVVNSGSFPSFTTALTPFHGRVRQFGLDAALLAGGYDLRTEWALTLTSDSGGDDPAVKNSSLSGVVQGSRSFRGGALTFSLAWAPRLVLGHRDSGDYASPGDQYLAKMLAEYDGQAYAFEQTGSARLSCKLLGETLQCDALFLASLEARDYLAVASATYNLADGLNLKCGAGLYGSFREEGDPERELGLFSNSRTIDKDYLFVELRVSL